MTQPTLKNTTGHTPPTLKNTTGHHTTHPLLCGANEADGDDLRTPSLELGHPVGQGGLRCNDNVWSWNISHETHVPQQCYRLQSLAQALGGRGGRKMRKKGEEEEEDEEEGGGRVERGTGSVMFCSEEIVFIITLSYHLISQDPVDSILVQ